MLWFAISVLVVCAVALLFVALRRNGIDPGSVSASWVAEHQADAG